MLTPTTQTFEIRLDPLKFYQLADLYTSFQKGAGQVIELGRTKLQEQKERIDTQLEQIAKADESFAREMRQTTKQRRRAFEEEDEDRFHRMARAAHGHSFIGVVLRILGGMKGAIDSFDEILRDLEPGPLALPKNRPNEDGLDFSMEALQQFSIMFQMNQGKIGSFVSAVEGIDNLRNQVVHGASVVAEAMDTYYQLLLKRHSVEGVEIFHNPVTTDIAISVYDNVDAHGEIEEGRDPDELSAYSVRKAMILAEVVKSQSARQFIQEPDDFINLVIEHFNGLWEIAHSLREGCRKIIDDVTQISDSRGRRRDTRFRSRTEFDAELGLLRDLNPNSVPYKNKTGLLSSEEQFLLKFRNKTLKQVARYLIDEGLTCEDLVQYILRRKAELHKYFTEENSFYVCKIGSGNQFAGEAPGGLEVIPGTKPSVNLEEIIGSGFDEIRDFIGQVETSGKWQDLFVATSPSRSADKSNVLLIGPQGCGKTEAMRAVGADTKSVSIFAQGSDFFTCWSGEAQKNPKRLFEHAVRLQRESDRHVYILIDEIDQVLHTDHRTGGSHFNLTREFQILMDGVVAYPHLSVWGATNHPERIPMPMIRRFSKALVVGKLNLADRVKLLQHYTGFMPVQGFEEGDWSRFAERLDGATGDIMRKIVDPIWRAKMRTFTDEEPERAQRLVDWLNDGEKFDIRQFNADKRSTFHGMLGEHVVIKPEDLDRSIDEALHNLAILNEIRTAKETYQTAESMLADLRNEQEGEAAE